MSQKRRKLHHKRGEHHYRKLFIISAEGAKTEKQYLDLLNRHQSQIAIKCLKHKTKSAPLFVLKRLKEYLKTEGLKKLDEAWMVVDRDKWEEEDLMQLHDWSKEAENYGFVLSNPSFDYWILLHFEEGNNLANLEECMTRLNKYLPKYHEDKDISSHKYKFTEKEFKNAIKRAEQKDKPRCIDWPRTTGTTMYQLVQKILPNATHFSPAKNKPK